MNIQTPSILEATMMTGMVTTKTGGDQDILAVLTDVLTTITTTHRSNIITDTVSPSTSTDSLTGGNPVRSVPCVSA